MALTIVNRDSEDLIQSKREATMRCLNAKAFVPNSLKTARALMNEGIKNDMTSNPDVTVAEKPFTEGNSVALVDDYIRSVSFQENWTRTNFYPDFQTVQQTQMNGFGGYFYPTNGDYIFPVENGIHFSPPEMLSHVYVHDSPLQDFQYFVVIDFEATCDKERKPYPQEIIEFPSVIVNCATGKLEASFQTYVRPSYHPKLSDFCKELTGIQQIQVDRGVSLNEALLMHDRWLEEKGVKQTSFAVVTWGNWDCKVMLDSECKFKRIQKPFYFDRWINLKVPFQDISHRGSCNLMEAVKMVGLAWEGRPHCGLDDARNTASLLSFILHRGFKLAITDSLRKPDFRATTSQHPHNDPSPKPSFQAQTPNELPASVAQLTAQLRRLPDLSGTSRRPNYCFCGLTSSKHVFQKPGPMQGRRFFTCGNLSSSCSYFVWASP